MKRSYRRSESDDSEILDLSPKIKVVKKKCYGYNFVFQVLPLNQPQNIPIFYTLIQYGSLERKIVAVTFFFDADLPTGLMHIYKFGTITFKRIVQMT